MSALESQGITEPFPIQALTIADALAGRDVCGKAKTGSGKTLAFGVPVLQRLGIAAVRSSTGPRRRPRAWCWCPPGSWPVRSRTCSSPWPRRSACELTACYGGTGMDAQIRALTEGTDVVVATPGRLIDLRQRGDVDLEPIEVVVLDEADRMADMGFMPQVEWLLRHLVAASTRPCSSPPPSTATLTGWSATS